MKPYYGKWTLDPSFRREIIAKHVSFYAGGGHMPTPERAYRWLIRRGYCRIERRPYRAPRVVWLWYDPRKSGKRDPFIAMGFKSRADMLREEGRRESRFLSKDAAFAAIAELFG